MHSLPKWVSVHQLYIFKAASGIYGYCDISNTAPTDCDGNWIIWNGTTFNIDPDFVIFNCSYFYSRVNNCSDESYLRSIGITPFNFSCISNLTYHTHLECTYYHNNICLNGIPVYNTDSKFLYYYWDIANWFIGSIIGSSSLYAFCDAKDCASDCISIWKYDSYCTTFVCGKWRCSNFTDQSSVSIKHSGSWSINSMCNMFTVRFCIFCYQFCLFFVCEQLENNRRYIFYFFMLCFFLFVFIYNKTK